MKNTLLFCFFSAMIFIMLLAGCSEDTTVNPPTSNTPQLGTLISTPSIAIQNTSTPVKFQLTVTPGLSVQGIEARLNRRDASGNLNELGILYDNGDTANGDEIANDGIFCGKINITESSTGDMNYVATAQINYEGQAVTSTSSSCAIAVYSSVSTTTILQEKQVLVEGKNYFLTALGGNINNYENALSQTATHLQSQPGVTSATYSSGTGAIYLTYSSGMKGGITVSKTDAQGFVTQGGFAQDSIRVQERRDARIPVSAQTRGTESRIPYSSQATEYGDNLLLDPNTAGNRNVFIYTPYRTVFTPDKVPIVKNALNQATCRDFQYTEYTGQAADVRVLADIPKYGFVFMDTHGVGGDIIFTGEVVDVLKPDFVQYYLPLILSGQIGLWERLVISHTGTAQDTATVYTTYSLFYKNLQGTFPNSVIFNSSCEGTMTDKLKDAFISKGAKVYYGYSKIVYSDFAARMADTVCRRFARGLKSDEAYFDATDPHNPYSAKFEMKVSNNVSFSFALLNGNYETGTLEGWTKQGDGRVLVRLGSVSPTQGSYLGIISTGLGYTTSSGSLSQCLKVENNQSTMTLKWNFLSEEFLEYINSQFQDYFQIKIIASDGSETVLLRKTIDQIAAQFGATQQSAGQLILVSPDIVFDQGNVYMTNWQSATFDVTAYRGQTITIVFSAGDVGDSIYDTAILLDEVNVQ